VLVHGDYGPNNVLSAPDTFALTAVVDWKWGHPGQAVEDLAWCEWIIRMHHRTHVEAFEQSFDDCGQRRPGLPGKRQWWSGASGC
jgi:aminoglycoside phosphotransferase (APT) family kinase protein